MQDKINYRTCPVYTECLVTLPRLWNIIDLISIPSKHRASLLCMAEICRCGKRNKNEVFKKMHNLMYNSMVFTIVTELGKHHNSFLTLSLPPKDTPYPLAVTSHSSFN